MTTYTGTDAKIETGARFLSNADLAQELIKAQAEERMTYADYRAAQERWNAARKNTHELTLEIAQRGFQAGGIVFGKSVITLKRDPDTEYLAAGVRFDGTLLVRAKTKSGKWFKLTQPMWNATASDFNIVRNEE